jgi:hypothetical protein
VKKRARPDYQVGDALSDAVKDEEAFVSIMYALEADPGILLARLRAGITSNAEQALAADLIEGKKKPKKPKGLPWYQRCELASVMVYGMDKVYPYGHPRGQRQIAIEEMVKYAKRSGYKVKSRYLYKILAEFNPQVLAKIKALRETPTRVKERFIVPETTIDVDGIPVPASAKSSVRGPLFEMPRTEGLISERDYDTRDIDHDNLVLLVEGFLARK